MNGNNDWQDEPFYQEISSESNFGGASGLATPFIILGLIAFFLYAILFPITHSIIPYILEAHFDFTDVIHNNPPKNKGSSRGSYSTGKNIFYGFSMMAGLLYIMKLKKYSDAPKLDYLLLCTMTIFACFQYNEDMISFYEVISNNEEFRELCLSIYKKLLLFRLFLFIPIILAAKVFSPDDFSLDDEKYSWIYKAFIALLVISWIYKLYLWP